MKRYPLIEEISTYLTAAQAFELFRQQPPCFFLDSGMDLLNLGRYSFIGSNPFMVLKSHGDKLTLTNMKGEEIRRGNPFKVLEELLQRYALEPCPPSMPLTGGAIGYFSYDLCHFIENVPSMAMDDLQLPECYMAFYDVTLAFDHLEQKTYIASSGFPEQDEEKRLRRAAERIQEVKERLLAQPSKPGCRPWHHSGGLIPTGNKALGTTLRSNFTHQGYLGAVEAVREYIASGDIFQVNLSQRFEGDLPLPPYEIYQHLRNINPAPFAACLYFDEVIVLSASPERFLKVEGDRVETRPMKGTRPRGSSVAEDEALARDLQSSTKDKAENVMIVDLERNDLGKVCRFGTVKVRELWTLEKYATVFQLTSCVEGRLSHDKNRIDLLKACFPGGSITGAPKVRAMEIIDELEPTRRGIYTGSIGYLSFSGAMDLNIAIRTILVKNGEVYFQVGGGIIYDSEPEAEYRETLDKAKALFQALSLPPHIAETA